MRQAASSPRCSILSRHFLDAIDNERLDGQFLRIDFEAKLGLHGLRDDARGLGRWAAVGSSGLSDFIGDVGIDIEKVIETPGEHQSDR